jgi:hypothetical protein
MDAETLKVVARFTPIGELWPVGAWIYCLHKYQKDGFWYLIKNYEGEKYDSMRRRFDHEISELEANQRGVFRNPKANSEK